MKVRLTMLDCSYKENESKKAVTCIVKAKSRIGTYTKPILAVGVAYCDDKDEYDVEKGKRLARAKAEKEAYAQHKKHIADNIKFLKQVQDTLVYQYEKAQGYIERQKEYIKSF